MKIYVYDGNRINRIFHLQLPRQECSLNLRILNQVKLSLLLSPSKAVDCVGYEMFVDKDVGRTRSCSEEQVHEQRK